MNAVAPQLLDTSTNRATFPVEVMAHAVAPEAIAGVIAFLVSDAAAPVSWRYCRRTALNEADTRDARPRQHPPARPRRGGYDPPTLLAALAP